MILVLFVALQVLSAQVPVAESSVPTEQEIVGIWKMCYEPGLPGVFEPSTGYLVLLPGGRYYEMRHDCCEDELSQPRPGTYVISENGVSFSGWTTLRFLASAKVVLFDDVKGDPRLLPVLAHERGLNYGFARVYPEP